MMRYVLTLAATLLSTLTAQAQQGTWTAEVPMAVKTVDGIQTVESTTTITMVLTVRGDSVTGTATRANSTVARQVQGLISGDSLTLRVPSKAQLNFNGNEQVIDLMTIYRLRRGGEVMDGTTETRRENPSPGEMTIPGLERDPAPVTLKRVKA